MADDATETTEETPKPSEPLPPIAELTDEELDQLAMDYVTQRVFLAFWGSEQWQGFDAWFSLVTSGLAAQGYDREELHEWLTPLAGAWNYYSAAGPIAVNGQPMFLGGHLLTRSSIERLAPMVDAKLEALRATSPKKAGDDT